nr:seroin 1 [Pseudoips prasinana]
MALTTVFTTVMLVAIAGAYPFPAEDSNGFQSAAFAGSMAGVQNIPFFSFPPGFPFSFPFPQFPQPITPQQITQMKPAPGQSYNAAGVMSSFGTRPGPNGTLVTSGQSTFVQNNNGHVTMTKVPVPSGSGYGTVQTFTPIKMKPMKPFKFKPFKEFEHFEHFQPHKFTPFPKHTFKPIKHIDIEEMKNHKPKNGTTYTGTSFKSSSFYSDVDGKVKSGGSVTRVKNDNGKVDTEHLEFKGGDSDE